jgi:hypothetical protein
MGAAGLTSNGGLAPGSFLLHLTALLVVGIFDLETDVFWDSTQWISLCGRHWTSKSESTGLVRPYLAGAIQVILLEYRVVISRSKAQGLAFIGYTWKWPCLKHSSVKLYILKGANPRPSIEQWQHWCIVSFLKIEQWESIIWSGCCLRCWLECCCCECCITAMALCFSISLFLKKNLCSVCPWCFRHWVGAEVGWNWYLSDTNIFPSSKNMGKN